MKKFIMLCLFLFSVCSVASIGACQIEKLDSCKADISSTINKSIQDKMLPNNLNQIQQPHNSFENRTKLGQPQIPENLNMEPIQEENTQPYDANCQFGNCLNRQNAGENANNR